MNEQTSNTLDEGFDAPLPSAPLGGNRAQAVQRLQVGLSGLAAMVLLVGLANIIQDRARVTQEQSVPEAAPTTEPSAQPAQTDPLADAGVVPDLPAEPSPTPVQESAIVPEQGEAAGDDAGTP